METSQATLTIFSLPDQARPMVRQLLDDHVFTDPDDLDLYTFSPDNRLTIENEDYQTERSVFLVKDLAAIGHTELTGVAFAFTAYPNPDQTGLCAINIPWWDNRGLWIGGLDGAGDPYVELRAIDKVLNENNRGYANHVLVKVVRVAGHRHRKYLAERYSFRFN